jgi:hypothetical protein
MPQVFNRGANGLARMSLVILGLVVTSLALTLNELQRSPYVTRQGERLEQPVPFSHQHHVAGLGLDCRYCHTSVENSSFAGIPPTKTCMNCHSEIWTNADILEPVRSSYRNNTSIWWTKIHDLPDFVYFNHEIHINKGIGCASCHGRSMKWRSPISTRVCRWSGASIVIAIRRRISAPPAIRFTTWAGPAPAKTTRSGVSKAPATAP